MIGQFSEKRTPVSDRPAASISAQCLLWRLYRPLIRRNRRHRLMAWTWLAIYGFIGVQMAWVLRPFIGDPNTPVGFFRQEAWGNAYVKLLGTVWSVLGG